MPSDQASEGEVIGMRLSSDAEADLEYIQNMLYFDDGGMRGLACAVIWCGLIHHGLCIQDGDLVSPSMIELTRTLLSIPVFCKSQGEDEASNMVRRIIKQNVDSKKLAVSSYEWSQILKNMVVNSSSTKDKGLTVQGAIDLYNSHPEVMAHGGSGKDSCFECCDIVFSTIMVGAVLLRTLLRSMAVLSNQFTSFV